MVTITMHCGTAALKTIMLSPRSPKAIDPINPLTHKSKEALLTMHDLPTLTLQALPTHRQTYQIISNTTATPNISQHFTMTTHPLNKHIQIPSLVSQLRIRWHNGLPIQKSYGRMPASRTEKTFSNFSGYQSNLSHGLNCNWNING